MLSTPLIMLAIRRTTYWATQTSQYPVSLDMTPGMATAWRIMGTCWPHKRLPCNRSTRLSMTQCPP